MSIAWKYLDKRRGALQAVKDYGSMKFIIENTDDEIKQVYSRMIGVGSPGMDGMPHAHDPKAGEERLVSGIEEIDVLKERYRQAMEYMDWFVPAWESLSEDERYVLRAFYGNDAYDSDSPIEDICREYHIERSSAYNRKNRALDHLVTLLFGKV